MKRSSTASTPMWQASLRETGILLREFRLPVLIFSIAVIGLGLLYQFLAAQTGEPLNSIPESIYLMLTLAFLQPSGTFPLAPGLQLSYVLMPKVGVATL